jgi:serine protease Do
MFRGIALSLLLLVATGTVRADDQPSSAQKAAIFAKSSVVRVLGFYEITFSLGGNSAKEYIGGMGSGFFASADGYVVTNAHVVEDIKKGDEEAKKTGLRQIFAKLARTPDFGRLTEAQRQEVAEALYKSAVVTKNNDIVLADGAKMKYEVVQYGKPGEGTDVAIIKVDTKDAPNLTIADSDRVELQDKVLAIGYPGAADMQGLLDDKSQLEASINDGAISAIKRTPSGDPIIQITASITHGNSGGPTINDKGEVIGLSTFGSKGEVQGFNFIVASQTVKRFLKDAKVNTAPSSTAKAWRKALEAMWAGDLDAAIQGFDEVQTLFQNHAEAPRQMKHARTMKKEGKGKKPPAATEGSASEAGGGGGGSSGAGIAIAFIVIGAIVLGVVLVVMKKKKATPGVPGHVVPPGMQGRPPQMGHPGQPHMPPPGAPGYPQPYAPQQPPGQVAKTMAIGGQQQHAPVAATAFGSLTLGSLTCTRGLLMGQRFTFGPQGLLIGRQPGVAQIVINDPRSSGKHVWIGYENGTLVAIDQGTTNGTFVNDVRNGRISKAPLKDGDVVIVSEPDCLSLTIKLS